MRGEPGAGAQRGVLVEEREGRRVGPVLEAGHAAEVVPHAEAQHVGEHALPREEQRGAEPDRRGRRQEERERAGEARRVRLRAARARRDGQRRRRRQQSRGAVVLLAEDAEPVGEPGRQQRRTPSGLEVRDQQPQRQGEEEQGGRRVAVHLPVWEAPDAVEPQQRHDGEGDARGKQPPHQVVDDGGEERELDRDREARDQHRRLEQAEEQRQQVEGAGQRVERGVAVEHAALRDDLGEEQHVPLVHRAEPAIEERELEADRRGRDRRGDGEPAQPRARHPVPPPCALQGGRRPRPGLGPPFDNTPSDS